MRYLLFSHWLRPKAISTFLAGAQGDLRGAKLIAVQAQLEKGAKPLVFALQAGGEQRASCRAEETVELGAAASTISGV